MSKADQIARETATYTKHVRQAMAFELHRERMTYAHNAKHAARQGRPGLAKQGVARVAIIDAEVARRISEGWLHLTPLQHKLSTHKVSGNGGFKSLSDAVASDYEDDEEDW